MKLPKERAKDHGPTHYKMGNPIEPIEFILANNLDFCEGNVVKYISRWPAKGGVEDLRKARHYIDFLIERETERSSDTDTDDVYVTLEDEPPF